VDHIKELAKNTVFHVFKTSLSWFSGACCLFFVCACVLWALSLTSPSVAEPGEPVSNKAVVETEIKEALQMQETLLDQVTLNADDAELSSFEENRLNTAGPMDWNRTPKVPVERAIPQALFDEEATVISKGTWSNTKDLRVLRLSLDADNDGKPEQVRYLDFTTRLCIRVEEDRNYDGRLDAWSSYRMADTTLHHRLLDDDDDGKADRWETYDAGRMNTLEIDRDGDGRIDVNMHYGKEFLEREEHDTNGDGKMDRHVIYQNGQRGEVHEDINHDGEIDVVSFYEEGKLKRRQIKQAAPTESR
jgi:hypothetical protein